ncbi:hypothetical protein G5I_07578 [Acromyrmex echinatior]|uniref:Uncharacterized protein n=1 Tax=Acromyrmex echinatior TaxID=103372 RepID=F4WP68_ACREC|nr:hypothetical protein G5I_07578 [Acromyrmex echinatior]
MVKGEGEEKKKVGEGKSAVWSKRPRAHGDPAGYFCKNINANSKGGSEARRACERVKAHLPAEMEAGLDFRALRYESPFHNYDIIHMNFDKRSSRADRANSALGVTLYKNTIVGIPRRQVETQLKAPQRDEEQLLRDPGKYRGD